MTNEKERIMVRIQPELKEFLQRAAVKEQRTVNSLVASILDDFKRNNGKRYPQQKA